MSNLIECKVGQPNLKIDGELKKVGDKVTVSEDTVALFRLSLIPIKKEVSEPKSRKAK